MYNLGVTLPHIHQDGVARLLPENRIQYEKDLQVSFPEKQEFFSDSMTDSRLVGAGMRLMAALRPTLGVTMMSNCHQ